VKLIERSEKEPVNVQEMPLVSSSKPLNEAARRSLACQDDAAGDREPVL
jgi:hypothetical protein